MPRNDRLRPGTRETENDHQNGGIGTEHTALGRQLRRRRAAAARLEPLPGGRQDRLHDPGEDLTVAAVAAWRAAWQHLHELGLTPLVPTEVMTTGRRQGCGCGCHREEVAG